MTTGEVSARVFDAQRLRILRSAQNGQGDVTLIYDGEAIATFPDETWFDKDEGRFEGLTDAALSERARVIALAKGVADDSPPPIGTPPVERHVAPDGRTMVQFHVAFDPDDIHRQQPRWRPRVFDARTGVKVLDLLRVDRAWRHAWETDGALRLTADGADLRIAPAADLFAMAAEGWQPHPIAQAQAAAMRNLVPWTEQDSDDGRVRRTTMFDRLFWPGVMAAIGAVAITASGGALPGVGSLHLQDPTPVNAWIVTCPDTDLPLTLHLTVDRWLEVPTEIAPHPLAALDGSGDRYGDGRVTVEIHGMNVRVRSAGAAGQVRDCVNPGSR